MAAEYQNSDFRVVDYQPYCLDENIIDRSTKAPLWVRGPGPPPLERGRYFVCLGAAQTFGRFCERPFPTLLQEKLGSPTLNISHGGAGPAFFCGDNERLLSYLNNAGFVVVQIMSGRSDSNLLFESEGVGYFKRRTDGTYLGCDEAFTELIRSQPRSILAQLVEETRSSWCMHYKELLSCIKVPKVLLWLASRPPHYTQGWDTLAKLFGEFPQLVNAKMVAEVRAYCEHYVECVTTRGFPQPLIDRFTGAPTCVSDPWSSTPWVKNWYYPSPEMHEDAASALAPVCQLLC
jgi:hypothetical protein